MRIVKFTFNNNVVPVSLGVPVFYWEECLWDTYRFSVFFDFLFGFSVLPQKISEYFRTDVSSDANTRNMSGLCKLLNVRGFCLMPLFLSCNKHRLSMRYGPFQGLKCTISHYDMCIIRPSNGHNQNVK